MNDYRAGTVAAGLVFISLFYARYFYLTAEEKFGYPAYIVAGAIHVGCWIAQVSK